MMATDDGPAPRRPTTSLWQCSGDVRRLDVFIGISQKRPGRARPRRQAESNTFGVSRMHEVTQCAVDIISRSVIHTMRGWNGQSRNHSHRTPPFLFTSLAYLGGALRRPFPFEE